MRVNTDPTEGDLADPMFLAVWDAIKRWDIRRSPDRGYAGATGTDVMTILNAIRRVESQEATEGK